MLDRVEIYTCKTVMDNDREYVYIYYMTESTKDIVVEDLEVSVASYGIGIVREEIVNGKVIETYEDRFDAVSPFKNKVMSLIDFLIDNEVSPVHLIDIIGENIDNWVSDYEIEAISKLNINTMA